MSTEKTQKVRIIFDKVKKIKGFDKDTELAEYLGITKQTLASWETRGRIANIKVFADKGYSEDWVRTGEGSVYPGSEVEVVQVENEELLDLSLFSKSQQLMFRALIAKMEEMTPEERDKAVVAALSSLHK